MLIKNTYAYILVAGMFILNHAIIIAMEEPEIKKGLSKALWTVLSNPTRVFAPANSELSPDENSLLKLWAAQVADGLFESLSIKLENGEGEELVDAFLAIVSQQIEEGKIKESIAHLAKHLATNMRLPLASLRKQWRVLSKDLGKDAVKLDRLLNKTGGLLSKTDKSAANVAKSVTNVAKSVTVVADKMASIKSNSWGIAAAITAAAIVSFAGIFGLRVFWNHVDRYLSTPSLILESSHKSLWQKMTAMFVSHENIPEIVFAPELKKRLETLIAATQNIQQKIAHGQKNVKYRNLMLWGPPGTGKTMFAKILAHWSNMEYVMVSGASFAQFKNGQGITEMNKLFEWAKRSKKGVLIFIDEAESFLAGRMGSDATKESYHILNNFLNHTGTRSDKFMIVLATNHPELLDSAMHSRIDDAVHIKLPELAERVKILRLYRDTLLLDLKQNSKEFVESVRIYFNDEVINTVAQNMDNFSGRELAGVINNILTDAAVTKKGTASPELIGNAVRLAIEKNHLFADHLKEQNKFAAAAA